jgi:hypothetical protein
MLKGWQLRDFNIQLRGIAVAASYSRSLSTIVNYPSADQFQLSSDIDRINSMIGGCKNSIAESVGLRLAFRYYIK